ncbi:MAG: GAF domain-containing protein, partial [Alcaligenes sp.]
MLTKQDRVSLPWTDTLARLEDERIMLERIAAGVPLQQVLEHVLHAIEAQSSVKLRASIALVDDKGGRLEHGAAPSLPDEFNAAVSGMMIEPEAGPWGAAAHSGCPVYVEDISGDPRWAAWRDVAAAHGLRACWSTPIKAPDGRLLGVFSNYYDESRLPSAHDIDAIALVTRSAALAIERHLLDVALRRSGDRWRAMFEGMQEAFFLAEALRGEDGRIADFRFLEVNPAFERQSGMREGDTLGHTLREMIPGVPSQILDTFAQVVETGEPTQFEFAVPAPNDAWYEARARKEGPDRIMALFLDVSARKAAETELWEGQHRKNFLLALGDRMRELHLQAAIEETACAGLGQHLSLGLVAVLDWAGDGAAPVVSTSWQSDVYLARQEPLATEQLGDDFFEAVRNGRTTYLQPLVAQEGGDVRPSAIVVPMRRWARQGGAMVVRPLSSSRLKPADLAFIEEVAERM